MNTIEKANHVTSSFDSFSTKHWSENMNERDDKTYARLTRKFFLIHKMLPNLYKRNDYTYYHYYHYVFLFCWDIFRLVKINNALRWFLEINATISLCTNSKLCCYLYTSTDSAMTNPFTTDIYKKNYYLKCVSADGIEWRLKFPFALST